MKTRTDTQSTPIIVHRLPPGQWADCSSEILGDIVADRWCIALPKGSEATLVRLENDDDDGVAIADPAIWRWYLATIERGTIVRARLENRTDHVISVFGAFLFRDGARER